MNNLVKIDNVAEDVAWNNWKSNDPISFTKSNSNCIPQNYYLFSYNYLPQILLNTSTPMQNCAFNNCGGEGADGEGGHNLEVVIDDNENHSLNIVKVKNDSFKSEDIDDGINQLYENTTKCNPGMLLQVELNTGDSPLLSEVAEDNRNRALPPPPTASYKSEATVLASGGFNHNSSSQNLSDMEGKLKDLKPCANNFVSGSNSDGNTVGVTEKCSSSGSGDTADGSFKCTICDKEFENENYVELHMAVHSQRGKSRPCDYCEQTFSSKGKWYAHFKTHFGDMCFDCPFCSGAFVTENYLQEHVKQTHAGMDEQTLIHLNLNAAVAATKTDGGGSNSERTYPCTFCEKSFPDRSAIMFHLRIHTADIVYRCTYCGKMFLNRSELNLHIRTHTGDKAHVCELCNKSFLTTSNLKQHFRIHTGDKPYCCTNCDKAFSNKSNLMQHIKVHTGEKPYHCKFCEKSFTTTSNLTQHLRTHTGVKPYVCAICGKAFINNSNLSQHKKVHYSMDGGGGGSSSGGGGGGDGSGSSGKKKKDELSRSTVKPSKAATTVLLDTDSGGSNSEQRC